jgi:hypothetical protein
MEMKNLPILIEDSLFDVNKNIHINVKTPSWGNYIEVDNFFVNFKKIHEIALTMPCTRLHGMYDVKENGQDYFDGRSYFYFHKTVLFHDVVKDIIEKVYNVKNLTEQTLNLGNNIFTWNQTCYDNNKNNGYSPHSDGENIVACLWYMNEEYDEEDGTGIYAKPSLYSKQSPWIPNDTLVDVIQAKPNRLVIYDGDVYHAAKVGKRWISDIRHSMVHFLTYK